MISTFELFRPGIGPSSSHTMGPLRAAAEFRASMSEVPARVEAVLLGSLAWTGEGHGSDRAVVLGLAGADPETVEPVGAEALLSRVTQAGALDWPGGRVPFDVARDVVLDRETPAPRHPNTLILRAWDGAGAMLREARVCSIGGGFVVAEAEYPQGAVSGRDVPHPFASSAELLVLCKATGRPIWELMLGNDAALSGCSEAAVLGRVDAIAAEMSACIERGMAASGLLPGRLGVRRRAPALHAQLLAERDNLPTGHAAMEWASLSAIAVNEENACGGRVVTAPTNGAAGVIPAVLRYLRDFCRAAPDDPVPARVMLLTASAIGGLIKRRASISGAEVGCQGEVGAAAAMAAGGLAAALGGNPAQVENAAEIAMEHHLGMTCDPIAGLVQVPCIERNAFGAVKAINAARLALRGDGTHLVSLDAVIEVMRKTGEDMNARYKETSQGGLAVALPEC